MKKPFIVLLIMSLIGCLCLFFIYRPCGNKRPKEINHISAKKVPPKVEHPKEEIETIDTTKIALVQLEKFAGEEEFSKAYPEIKLKPDTFIINKPDSIIFRDPHTKEVFNVLHKKSNEFTKKELAFFKKNKGTTLDKKMYNYYIAKNNFLVEGEGITQWANPEIGEDGSTIGSSMYNCFGQKIVHIGANQTFDFSQDCKHFIIYDSPDMWTNKPIKNPGFSIYDFKGNLIKKQVFENSNGYLEPSYTEDGKYITVTGVDTLHTCLIFNNQGKQERELHNKIWGHSLKFVSDSSKYTIDKWEEIILIDNIADKELWRKKHRFKIEFCKFYLNLTCILIGESRPVEFKGIVNHVPEAIKIVSLTNGQTLALIDNAEIIGNKADKIFVKKEGEYFVYKIKKKS